jgi:ABC-type sugar transport system permease subunit
MLPINRHPSASELRSFSRLWLPLFVVVVGALAWWRLESPATAITLWIVGGTPAALALRSPEAARQIFVGLQTLTYPIALVVSTLALATLFYAVFTPIGWVLRLTGHDPLQLRRGKRSRWIPYTRKDDAADAMKQY